MDLSRYVVLDCTSGTFFNPAHTVVATGRVIGDNLHADAPFESSSL